MSEKKKTTLSQFRTDPKASQDGVWVSYVTGELVADPNKAEDNELVLKVARIGNPLYAAAVLKAGTSAARTGSSSLETASLATQLAVSKHILLNWMNLWTDNDNECPYSDLKSRELCTSPEYKDFYETVLVFARDAELFRNKADREAVGNSLKSSSGDSATDRTQG